MQKPACIKCGIVDWSMEEEVSLCSLCKIRFREWYHKTIMSLHDQDPDKILYIQAMKLYGDLKN